nr:GyrI-like domain-containing protein [uncultured Flavobacterium sp.]
MNIINISQPEIVVFPGARLIGLNQKMSFAQNTTQLLWQTFMPRRKEIQAVNHDLYSIQLYPEGFFEHFNPAIQFEKWAATAVTTTVASPTGMEIVAIPEGKYAVFLYKGNPANGAEVFRYIFTEWLPQSGYVLDNRPHFEVQGDKYKNGSDDSEESIYIPVK